MANLVTNTLQATIISQEDTTQNVPVNRAIDAQMDAGLGKYNFGYATNFQVALDPSIGITRFYQLYIRNMASADSEDVIGVYKGITGGGLRLIATLGPGDVFIFWGQNNASTTINTDTDGAQAPGFIGISIKSSGVKTPVEWFIGGV